MATIDILDKNLTYDIFPSQAGVTTFPVVFDEPIPFKISLSCTYQQISNDHNFSFDVNVTGVLKGFTQDRVIPYVRVYAESSNTFYAWDLTNATLDQIGGTAVTRENGQITQNVQITSANLNNFNSYIRNPEMFDNFRITVGETSIPVIYNALIMAEPDKYYYTGQWDSMTLSDGYDVRKCLNGADDVVPDGLEFTIRNSWTHGTWTSNQQPPVSSVNWRCLRGKIIDGRFCLYRINGISDGVLKFGIMSSATFFDLEISSDGENWTPAPNNEIPFTYFYRPRVNELGEFDYGLTFENDAILIFSNEEDAEDYDEDGDNADDAENWDDVADNYPPSDPIGEPDEEPTEMGEIYTRAFFSQQYICSAGALQEISNALFDTSSGGATGIWEDIKKGLEMYGDSPVDDIQGCMFFPFQLDTVFTNVMSQNYIYFGGYKFDMQNSVKKIIYPNGKIDFGSWFCPERFGGSFRDFSPFRRIYCYLPYVGWTELDIKRYIGKTVSVTYYVDTRTGGCMACLFADGILYDYFNGQMGISMPITATDYVAYANAQINTLLGGAGSMKNNAGTIGQAGANMVMHGASIGATALGLAPVAGIAVGASATKTLYGLTQNNINNFNVTKGGSSSMLNGYLPQNVMFLDEVQDGKATPNELSLMGYPSNASGNLQNFSGYLECDAVNLKCDTATENERAEILAYLKSGVII